MTDQKQPKSTMSFDDGNQLMVFRDRWDPTIAKLTQVELIQTLLDEASLAGLEPCDRNYAGKPNIYLRSKYRVEKDGTETNIGDVFVMFVRKPYVPPLCTQCGEREAEFGGYCAPCDVEAEGNVLCPICGGRGILDDISGNSDECPECAGEGEIPKAEEEI